MKPVWIFQVRSGREYEQLDVYGSGRIICSCLNNLYHKGRDENSICKHATQLREDILENNLEKYIIIQF